MSLTITNREVQQNEIGCILVDNGAYHESLRLCPIAWPTGNVELHIESRLDTARDPLSTQVRYRTMLDRAGLIRLQQAIDAALTLTALPVLQEQGDKLASRTKPI
jgi:hypothetical protein